ncbi:MAG: hypothetical protein QNK89_11205 [Lacinutrix sp.]|uniref:hypothetical protein n=1 Tax=Lacinutrix sp. TaxID=1937692 RepID=UPI00309A3A6F
MNKFFVIIGFSLCCLSDTTEIPWQENHKLEWADFKGEPDQGCDSVVVTASGITFSYSIEKSRGVGITGFKTKVFAHFYPEYSWCKKAEIDASILNHEQLHFNITELNVRCFREKIATLKASNLIEKELSQAHEKANTNLQTMQNLYDTESNNSINSEGQEKWVAFVAKELKRLEKFKSK